MSSATTPALPFYSPRMPGKEAVTKPVEWHTKAESLTTSAYEE
jgi:hypothetical protein